MGPTAAFARGSLKRAGDRRRSTRRALPPLPRWGGEAETPISQVFAADFGPRAPGAIRPSTTAARPPPSLRRVPSRRLPRDRLNEMRGAFGKRSCSTPQRPARSCEEGRLMASLIPAAVGTLETATTSSGSETACRVPRGGERFRSGRMGPTAWQDHLTRARVRLQARGFDTTDRRHSREERPAQHLASISPAGGPRARRRSCRGAMAAAAA